MVVKFDIPKQDPIPLTPGANSPQQSAYMANNNMQQSQTALNNAVSGGKKTRSFNTKSKFYSLGGNTGTIPIQPTSTASYNVNGIVKTTAGSSINSQSNAEFDKLAFKGGSKKIRTKKRRTNRRRTHKKCRNKNVLHIAYFVLLF